VRARVPAIFVAAFVVIASTLPACRSASHDLAPSAPEAPHDVSAQTPPTAGSTASPAVAPSPAAPDTALPPKQPTEEREDPVVAEDTPTDALQSVEKEALDLCQSAKALLDQGKVDEAVVATDRAYELMLSLPANGDALQAKQDIRVLVAGLIDRLYAVQKQAPRSPALSWDLGLPITSNGRVQSEVQSFTGAERQFFIEGYRRSGRYRPMILAKLKAAGLPSQLSWLPLVESWFQVRALSRASALGMWQFIASTGARYSLSRDAWVDERLDPVKSTDAAIAYLSELHGMFGDWPKALAAYNCGEAYVMRVQRRSNEYQDFWDLYETLPFETRRYVPRLLAALQVVEDPAAHGMTLPEPDPPLSPSATVSVARSVRLDSIDAMLGLEKGTLAVLNPELRHAATPKGPYDLKVPEGAAEKMTGAVAGLPEWTPPVPAYVLHRVRSGETLSVIARHYGTTVSAIMRTNSMGTTRIRAGQSLRIPARGAAVQRTSS
jgi:membrane-bound lytic murein transglycosylase D